jgi:hypothetical protein
LARPSLKTWVWRRRSRKSSTFDGEMELKRVGGQTDGIRISIQNDTHV